MIFRLWQQVLDGTKTQTRRQVKPGEEYNDWGFEQDGMHMGEVLKAGYRPLFSRHGKWIVGRTYAVQPGSGRPAVGQAYALIMERQAAMAAADAEAAETEAAKPARKTAEQVAAIAGGAS